MWRVGILYNALPNLHTFYGMPALHTFPVTYILSTAFIFSKLILFAHTQTVTKAFQNNCLTFNRKLFYKHGVVAEKGGLLQNDP